MSKKQQLFYSKPYGFQRVDIPETKLPDLTGLNGPRTKTNNPDEIYNIAKIMTRKHDEPLNLPEYASSVEIQYLPGRGRGVTATQDIIPGQLIIVSRALAIVYPDSNLKTASKLVQDVRKLGALRNAVAELLQKNNDASKLVYQLHAGPKLGVLGPDADPTVDIERIERICSLNGFENTQAGPNGSSYGLWFLPSFLNHDCAGSNAHWSIYQDYMFIRATKGISTGQEILISYVDPNQTSVLRRKFYIKHEFQCACKLCELEKAEGQTIRRKRDILLQDFQDEAPCDPEIIQEYIEDLESLRPSNPELNIFLVQPLIQLGLSFYEKSKYAEAANALQSVCDLCNISAQFSLLAVSCVLTIATCFLRLGNLPEAEIWFERSKKALMIQFGTLSAAEIVRPSFVQEMKSFGFELKCK